MWSSEGVVAGGAGDAKSVEGNVPRQLFPVRARQVVGHAAGHAGAAEDLSDVMRARLGPTLEFAYDDLAVGHVLDQPGLKAIQTIEAESDWKQTRELLLIAQPILQRDHCRRRTDERRQQVGELIVGCGLECYEDQLAGAYLRPGARALGPDLKVTLRAADENPFASHSFV